MVGESGINKCGAGLAHAWSTGSGKAPKTVLRDGRSVVLKPVHQWADPRIARLLYGVRSPYLPRCFGLTSAESLDCGDQQNGRMAVFVERDRSEESSEPLPFLECRPSPCTASIVFEWIDGRTMREIDRREMSSTLLEKWFDDVLDGLMWLGQCAGKPLAHLDISPDNIVISDSGDALLIDFAGARILDGRAAVPETSRVFKEGYAAPEIFLGELLPESDLYALAKTILSVWSGEPASTLTHASAKGSLRKLDASFSERLRCCLSDDPLIRRGVLDNYPFMPVLEVVRQLPSAESDLGCARKEEDDTCPYSFSTCPFLEVAYIICSG